MNVFDLRKLLDNMSDKEFWDGIRHATRKGWIRREGNEIVVLQENPPLGDDEKLIAVLAEPGQ